MVDLAVVIPNWNGRELLKNCLKSLEAQTERDFLVYVVDNGSEDGSKEMVKKEFPAVRLIALNENTGFARGSNLGIRQALKDNLELKYICPLNNDILLLPDYLETLVNAAEGYEKQEVATVNPDREKETKLEQLEMGILAAKLYFKDQPELINTVGTLIQIDGSGMERGFKEMDQGQYDDFEEIFGSCGAAALYAVPMLKTIAFKNARGEDCFFDEDFFAYYEDLDLNFRSRLAGFKAFLVPAAQGYHVHSATGKSFSPFKSFHVHRNQYYVLIKNFPWPFLLRGLLFMPIRYGLLFLSALKGQGPAGNLKKNIKAGEQKEKEKERSAKRLTRSGEKNKFQNKGLIRLVLAGWLEILKNLPQLLKKRREIQNKRKVGFKEFNSWFKQYKADLKKMIFES